MPRVSPAARPILADGGTVVALPREDFERRTDQPLPALLDEVTVLDGGRDRSIHTERSVSSGIIHGAPEAVKPRRAAKRQRVRERVKGR